jgi:hypothetical protein
VLHPTGVVLNGSSSNLDRTLVMSNDISLKSFPKNESQVTTRYVMPYRLFPNKLRLVHYPPGTKVTKTSVAYKYVNKDQMDEELFKKKYKLEHQFFVVTEKDNLCNVNILRGSSI